MARRNSGGAGGVIGILLLIGLALLILKWVLITAAILAVPFGVWWLLDHHSRHHAAREGERARQQGRARRREIESLAAVDVGGGCGWCGSRVPHRDRTGRIVLPLDYHRVEVEHTIDTGVVPVHARRPGPLPALTPDVGRLQRERGVRAAVGDRDGPFLHHRSGWEASRARKGGS